jgi:hypothetical protein
MLKSVWYPNFAIEVESCCRRYLPATLKPVVFSPNSNTLIKTPYLALIVRSEEMTL